MPDSRIENQLREILGEQADLSGIPQSRIEELLQRIISEGGGSGGGCSEGGGENAMIIPLVQTGVDADEKPSYTINTPIDDIIEHMSNGGTAYFKLTQQNVAGTLVPALLYFNAPSGSHILGGNKQVLGGSVMPTLLHDNRYTVTYITYSDDNGTKKVSCNSIVTELKTEIYVTKYTDPDEFELYYKTPTMQDPEEIHTFSEFMNIDVDVAYVVVYYIDNDTGIHLTGQNSFTGDNALKYAFLDTSGSDLKQIIVTIAEGDNDALNITEDTKTYSAGSDVLYANLTSTTQDDHHTVYDIDVSLSEIVHHIANGGTAYIIDKVHSIVDEESPEALSIGTPSVLIPITMYSESTLDNNGTEASVYTIIASYTMHDSEEDFITFVVYGMEVVSSGVTINKRITAAMENVGRITIGNTNSGVYIYGPEGGRIESFSKLRSSWGHDYALKYYSYSTNDSPGVILGGQGYYGDNANTLNFVFINGKGAGLKKITVSISDDGNDGLNTTVTETVLVGS